MREIKLKEYKKYKVEEILDLYKAVEWSNYYNKPEILKEAYQHSLYILGAYLEEELVGIIRVVGDGASIIFVQDLLVHPEYQRKGVGRLLLLEILEKYQQVHQKVLLTDNTEKTKAFYKKVGMTPLAETNGLCFVNYTF